MMLATSPDFGNCLSFSRQQTDRLFLDKFAAMTRFSVISFVLTRTLFSFQLKWSDPLDTNAVTLKISTECGKHAK